MPKAIVQYVIYILVIQLLISVCIAWQMDKVEVINTLITFFYAFGYCVC